MLEVMEFQKFSGQTHLPMMRGCASPRFTWQHSDTGAYATAPACQLPVVRMQTKPTVETGESEALAGRSPFSVDGWKCPPSGDGSQRSGPRYPSSSHAWVPAGQGGRAPRTL